MIRLNPKFLSQKIIKGFCAELDLTQINGGIFFADKRFTKVI